MMDTHSFNLSSRLQFISTFDEDVIDHLKKRGRTFSCTNLNLQSSNLKTLSNLLSNDMVKLESFNDASCSYNAVISLVNVTSDYPCLKICVEKCQNNGKNNCIYEGVFFTWRTSTNCKLTGDMKSSFLYCIGRKKIVKIVNELIEKHFSCTVTAIIFPQMEIKWLMVLALQCIADTMEDMKLTYAVVWGSTEFTFQLSFCVLKNIWINVHNEDSRVVSYEEVVLFHSSFEEHISNIMGIELSRTHLKTIAIPGYVVMDVSGKIQISKVKILDTLYRFLTDSNSISL